MLEAPAINFISPVEIDEVYVTAVTERPHKRDSRSRSRGLSRRGRGSCDKDKPTVFTLVDRGSGLRHAVPTKSAD